MSSPILVTGAAGFAGSHLLDLLAPTPARRRRLASARRLAAARRSPARGGRRSICSIARRSPTAIDRAAAGGRVSLRRRRARRPVVGHDRRRRFATNVLGTHHLLEALERAGVTARVLIPSSALVYAPADEALTEEHPLRPGQPVRVEQAGAGDARRCRRTAGIDGDDRARRSTISARARIRTSSRRDSRGASPTSRRDAGRRRSRSAISTRGAISPTCATRCARTG